MKAKLILTVAEAEKDHDKWLAVRNMGLGGSDAGVVMGYNPHKSRLRLWMEKTGQAPAEDLSDNERVYWGVKNENNIAEYFCEKTGKKVRRCGTMQSTDHPWLIANVDRLVEGENAGLEIKTAGVNQSALWQGDEIPDAYYAQVQHYMLVTGCDKWYIAVLLGGNKGLIKEVPRHEGFIRDLFTAEAGFWTLVENRIIPTVDGNTDTKKALGVLYPQAVKNKCLEMDSSEELEHLFRDYAQYRKMANDMKMFAEECENKIKALMGDNETAVIGEHKASWINIKGRTTIDAKRLEKENPKIYKEYLKVGNPTRKFTMK